MTLKEVVKPKLVALPAIISGGKADVVRSCCGSTHTLLAEHAFVETADTLPK
jgi:hypothetical protein